MEDGIASANGCVLAAERLPRKTDARFERSLVHLDADSAVGVDPGDQIVATRRRSALAVEIKVSLAIFGLGDWRIRDGFGHWRATRPPRI